MEFGWIFFAFICGLGFKFAHLPPLVGYLFAGFILHLLGTAQPSGLNLLADLGVTLMLFTVGLKLNVRDLLKPEIWISGSAHLILWTLLLSGLLNLALLIGLTAWLPPLQSDSALLFAFALGFSSTVGVVKLLQDNGELSTRHGRVAVGILVLQDVLAVIYLVVVTGQVPSPWAIGLILLWWTRRWLDQLLQKTGHSELLPLAGIVLALGAYQLCELVGVKGNLGALLAGLLLSESPKAAELAKSLLTFKDVFLIGFFVSIGFTALPDWGMLTAALLLAILLMAKFILFFFIFCLVRLRARSAFLSALLMSNYSEFGLIVLALSAQLQLIDPTWLVVLALAVAFSFALTNVAYRFAHPFYSRFKPRVKRYETRLRLREDVYLLPQTAEILVIGMGRVGRGAYDALDQMVGEKVWGVDADRDRVRAQKRKGMRVFPGDGEDPELWENLALDQIKLVLLALPSVRDCHSITEQLRSAQYRGKIVAIVRYQDEEINLLHAGIDRVFNFFTEAGFGFAEESLLLVENPVELLDE